MAIPLPKRTKQITARISATTNRQERIIYTPSTATLLGTQINYNGAMARIRVYAALPSLPETFAPVILPTDTLAQKEQKNQMFRSQPKKGLMAYLENPGGERFEVGIIDCFNVNPGFLTGVNEFFSDLDLYGIEWGYKIVLKVVDRGFGLLQLNTEKNLPDDFLSITGCVYEEGSFLQGKDDTIYNFVGV